MHHHLIFEGAELSGKSWIMSQIYEHLESKYNRSKVVLDGCHWFNCDVGIFGTEYGKPIIEQYLNITKVLDNTNILMEKLHISDIVYNRLHFNREVNYVDIESRLLKLDFKIIFITFPEDEDVLNKRIQDRINLYPHYERIRKSPNWYINQQTEYTKEIKKSNLPHLKIKTDSFPNSSYTKEVLKWIKEL